MTNPRTIPETSDSSSNHADQYNINRSGDSESSNDSSTHLYGLLGLLLKLGGKLSKPVLTLLKGGKSLKVLLAGGSFAAYSVLLSWQFAVLLMVGIGIHEMGHLAAMRYKDMDTKGMYYIPMLGAAAVPEEDFPSYWGESFIAAAGPVTGLLVGVATLAWYMTTGTPFAAAATAWIGLIHIFNLLPVKPLDGGRMWSAIAFSFGRPYSILVLIGIGLLAVGVGAVYGLGVILLIAPLGILEIISDYMSNRRTIRPGTPITEHDITGFSYKIKPDLYMSSRDDVTLLNNHGNYHENWTVTDVDDTTVTMIPSTVIPLTVQLIPFMSPEYDEYVDDTTSKAQLSHDAFRSLVKDEHTGQPKPRMDRQGLVNTLAMYSVLLVVSVGLMLVTNHVAGADAALSALT